MIALELPCFIDFNQWDFASRNISVSEIEVDQCPTEILAHNILRQQHEMEETMVETNQLGRFWPHLYEPLRGFGNRISDWLSPASEASSDDDIYRISIELPGVSEDDIDIRISDDSVIVSGEKSEKREDKGETWYFCERQFGSFRRSFRLPPDANGEKAQANVKDGVLEITVPKRSVKADKSRKIDVKKAS